MIVSHQDWELQNLRIWLTDNKQLLDEVEQNIMNYQNWGLC